MSNDKKQAVLLIHGIGEQRPMDTLRGFVETVWTSDKGVQHQHAIPGVFSKPDQISGSFELRRLTTTKNKNEVYTDFFELYWAHLMEGTTLDQVLAWTKKLLWRWPWKVPRRLLTAWFLLVVFILVIAFFALQTVLPEDLRVLTYPRWFTALLSVFVSGIAVPIINNIIGDAARYLTPAPINIKRRQEIRTYGVEILEKLHKSKAYDRIILIGHSLGSMIGYDILTFAWSLYNEKGDKSKPHPVLDSLERAVEADEMDIYTYQKEQRKLQQELFQDGNPWLVTDFITLGSPLTHADLLLAEDKKDLEKKQAEKEIPTCPPVLESGKFSYPHGKTQRTLHHAAVFGPTRWTNLYFPARGLIFGDLIGGPLKDLFGWGVNDLALKTKIRGGLFSHSYYWRQEKGKETARYIQILREAINLLDS